jgi:hypothetical protein
VRSRCDGKKTGCQPKVLVVDLGGFTADYARLGSGYVRM